MFQYREFAKRCKLMALRAPRRGTTSTGDSHRPISASGPILLAGNAYQSLPSKIEKRASHAAKARWISARCRRNGVGGQFRLSGKASNFADVTWPRSSPHRASAVCWTRSWLTGHASSLCSPFASSAGAEKLSPGTLRCFQSRLPAVPDRRRFHGAVWSEPGGL